ncbi:hypothetical protein [Actinomyces ruminis]|uniref:Uncharacterized protein n=1 Tax=Actinomyces ruminis TaxID=1937003 RepID=A0ABX4MCQ5_9ACTO|nr:hypothetical protein [Actinomyces ruminis]PHP53239.1 hypothetical protein BW737_003850 [Actinomyces ruminis]
MPDLPDDASTPAADTPDDRNTPKGDDARTPAASNPQPAKAARRRKVRMLAMACSAVLLIILTFAWLRDPEHREAEPLSGYVTGVTMAICAFWLIGWWVRRRGGSSYSRALDGTQDERDELIWKSAWALTGKVDWILVLGAVIVALFGVELELGTAAIIALWVNIIALYGSRFYFERTM